MSDGNGGVSALDLTDGQAGNAQYLTVLQRGDFDHHLLT